VGSCEHGNEPYALLNGATLTTLVEKNRASVYKSAYCVSFCRTAPAHITLAYCDLTLSHFSSDDRRKRRQARATDGIVLSRASCNKSKVTVPEFDAHMTAHALYAQKYRYGCSHTAALEFHRGLGSSVGIATGCGFDCQQQQ
jgi:hypothetical protein